jgi:squalene synthase HpnC
MIAEKQLERPFHSPQKIRDAYRYCEQIVRRHYENFPVASLFIPKNKRKHFYAAYAFMRVADDLADNGDIELNKRLETLVQWQGKLDASYQGQSEDPIFIALQDSIEELLIPKEIFDNILNAFKVDLFKHRYRTFDELLEYCRYSANPVGHLVLHILGYAPHPDRETMVLASDHLCTALQLTNHWQDIFLDKKIDRLYLPLEDLETYGYSIAEWNTRVVNENFRRLMKFQIDRTRDYFTEARQLFRFLKFPERFEIALIWHGGMRIIERIENSGYDVGTCRPTLTLVDKTVMFANAMRQRF